MAITRGIKHWGLGGYSSILPRSNFGVSGQGTSPQSLTAHSLNRYGLIYNDTPKNIYCKLEEGL